MSFNLKYQTVSSDFTGWTSGTLPVVSITGANYGDTEPYTTFVIDFSPTLPTHVSAFLISKSRIAVYGATKSYYRMDQISPQKFSSIEIGATTLNFNVYGAGAGPGPSGNFVTYTAPSTTSAIPVFGNTSGAVGTFATSTPATLSRPLQVDGAGAVTPLTVSTTNANCFVRIATTGTATNRGAIIFGRSAVGEWTVGTDKDNTNSDNFFIFRNGNQAFVIEASDQIAKANYGSQAPRYILTNSATNPGGQAIWKDTALTRPSWTTLGQLALLSDITTPTPVGNSIYATVTAVSADWTVTSGGTLTLRRDTRTGLTYWKLGVTRLTYTGADGGTAPVVIRWTTVPTNQAPSSGEANGVLTGYPTGTPHEDNLLFRARFAQLSGLTLYIYPTHSPWTWTIGSDYTFGEQSGFYETGTPV